MAKKETATAADLLTVVGIMEEQNIAYWIDGGWGVDVLAGKQTRPHRDIDLDYDARHTETLLTALAEHGYTVETDRAPVRIELHSEKLGYLDIHPFILAQNGTAKQADLQGGFYEFPADYFGQGVFGGKAIPCISAKGQKAFHTGYPLRETDLHDLEMIEELLK